MNPRTLWNLLKKTFTQWSEDKPFQLGAALAYYTLFSLAPLLLVAIAVAGLAFGREAAQNQILGAIGDIVGIQSGRAIQAMIESAGEERHSGLFATFLGMTLLLIGAGGVVGQLQDSLNTIWGVVPKGGRFWWEFIKDRFVSFSMVLGVGFLLLVSLVVSAALTAVTQIMTGWLPRVAAMMYFLDLAVSFAFITFLFALIYKFIPDVRIAWKDVWIGAAMTSFLFSLGKLLIGFYLARSTVTSIYGAAGSLVTLLLWVYYSSLIFFFGAEFTQVYASEFGSGVLPTEKAKSVALQRRESPPPEARAL
ncbi:MAG: YihY/virulence factor BrkB family protein [Candidatus Binatia bacterium]